MQPQMEPRHLLSLLMTQSGSCFAVFVVNEYTFPLITWVLEMQTTVALASHNTLSGSRMGAQGGTPVPSLVSSLAA